MAMRPYALASLIHNPDDAVNMVGHDHPFVQFDLGADGFGSAPFLVRDSSVGVQLHPPIDDPPEEHLHFVRAQSHEIFPGP
ncbi:MAG: hypothetical protein ACRD2G_10775 [Terriglobia bacterium]